MASNGANEATLFISIHALHEESDQPDMKSSLF